METFHVWTLVVAVVKGIFPAGDTLGINSRHLLFTQPPALSELPNKRPWIPMPVALGQPGIARPERQRRHMRAQSLEVGRIHRVGVLHR